MEEVRVKILKIDRGKIEKKLVALGAIKNFEGEICASFFDVKEDRDKNNESRLIVRKIEDRTLITVKKPITNSAIEFREEYSFSTSDFHETKNIIKSLGLVEYESTRFHRAIYTLKDLTFKFDQYYDKYSNVPEFFEIQANDLEMIYEYAKALGIKKENCLPISTAQLLKEYKNKN
ncbi:MAG: CYTH domain-containing protein [Patescibacteria group bacterium]|nr:CYTH domain-containing protein [Patescibacteria group bacterium]